MTELTAKEQAALDFLARNNGAGAKTQTALLDDNCSWFDIGDLMRGLGLNKNEAAGIMSALAAKGLADDYEAGSKVRYDRATWYVTTAGVRASALPV